MVNKVEIRCWGNRESADVLLSASSPRDAREESFT